MAKVIRYLKQGSTRRIPLVEPRQKRPDEADEAWAAYQKEANDWDGVMVDVRMVSRPEFNNLAKEWELLTVDWARIEKNGTPSVEDALAFNERSEAFWRGVLRSVLVSLTNVQFEDAVSGEVKDSDSLSGDDLFAFIEQCRLNVLIGTACFRAQQLTEDQKKA